MYVCMHACMYVSMYVCLFTYVHVCSCMFVYAHVGSCMYVCMSVCLYVCMYVCMTVCLSLCLSVCLSVGVSVCMYACTCYTHDDRCAEAMPSIRRRLHYPGGGRIRDLVPKKWGPLLADVLLSRGPYVHYGSECISTLAAGPSGCRNSLSPPAARVKLQTRHRSRFFLPPPPYYYSGF